jgi:hypothetical protein
MLGKCYLCGGTKGDRQPGGNAASTKPGWRVAFRHLSSKEGGRKDMRFTYLPIIVAFGAATLVPVGGTALAAPPAQSQQTSLSMLSEGFYADRATELLEQVRDISFQLSLDCERLKAVAAAPALDWRSHANYLAVIRDHINRTGDLLREMDAIRRGLSAWQQQAMDRVVPVAAELARRTEAAIVHLRENPSSIRVSEYRDHVSAMSDHSDEMKQYVSDFLEYGETRENLRELEMRLELAS